MAATLQNIQETLFPGRPEPPRTVNSRCPIRPGFTLPLRSNLPAAALVPAGRRPLAGLPRQLHTITALLLPIVYPESLQHIPTLFLDHAFKKRKKKKKQSTKVFASVVTWRHQPEAAAQPARRWV